MTGTMLSMSYMLIAFYLALCTLFAVLGSMFSEDSFKDTSECWGNAMVKERITGCHFYLALVTTPN